VIHIQTVFPENFLKTTWKAKYSPVNTFEKIPFQKCADMLIRRDSKGPALTLLEDLRNTDTSLIVYRGRWSNFGSNSGDTLHELCWSRFRSRISVTFDAPFGLRESKKFQRISASEKPVTCCWAVMCLGASCLARGTIIVLSYTQI
jgi:hypothetical protein